MRERQIVIDKRKKIIINLFFLILCGVTGVFIKHLINPIANTITTYLHIPGGISTAVSLMFLVLAATVSNKKWCATLMGAIQGFTALYIGMVGSMGILIPLAYILPGISIDLIMLLPKNKIFPMKMKAFLANIFSSLTAALFANFLVFRLPISILSFYLAIAALSGGLCGLLAGFISKKMKNWQMFFNE